ncbi:hypothetical protein BC829DRAFT_385525 [Chytridium lagenaria]|nr:hypothetical protein BC829DRAFT_385525 [Chytridium lagenaria]
MAVPKELWDNFTPAEIEFITENEIITITPLRRLPAMDLLTGYYGPFIPPRTAQVPLWLALFLKRNGNCNIQPPAWLDAENLNAKIEDERSLPGFSSLPFHYMAIANLLVTNASEDIPRLSDVVEALKTLRDIRQAKATAGLKLVNADLFQQGSHLVMDGLSLMEINEIRPVFVEAFGRVRSLLPAAASDDRQQQQKMVN